jgi:hypothetical protein
MLKCENMFSLVVDKTTTGSFCQAAVTYPDRIRRHESCVFWLSSPRRREKFAPLPFVSLFFHIKDGMSNYNVNVDKKHRQAMRWPDGFPQELKSSIKLGFWVWFCTAAALLVLVTQN